jgi:hypothetical protein
MPERKLDKLASDIDEARTVADEIRHDREQDLEEKLDELDAALEHASDHIDELENDE